jgi:hypothetical protein
MADAPTIVRHAIDRLKTTITPEHQRKFPNDDLGKVWEVVRELEEEHSKRKSLRYMARIEPFLRTVESYSSLLDVACQGFSPIVWVWASEFQQNGTIVS